MAGAVANVQQIITIQGVDNASEAVRKAQSSLKGLEAQTIATGNAASSTAESFGDNAKGLSGMVAKGLKGVSAFAGSGRAAMTALGESAEKVGSLFDILPPQLGLAAIAVTGVGTALYSWVKGSEQAAAKLGRVADTNIRKLGDDLGYDADQTVALAKAMSDLGDTVRPTEILLRAVAEQAKEIGGDPVEAQKALISAWKEGPEALRRVSSELGVQLRGLQSLHDVAMTLNVDPFAAGIDKAANPAKELTDSISQIALLRSNIATLEAKSDEINQHLTASNIDQLHAVQARLQEARNEEQSLLVTVRLTQQQLQNQQQFTQLKNLSASVAQSDEARAALAGTKEQARAIRLESIETQRRAVNEQLRRIKEGIAGLDAKSADEQARALMHEGESLDVKRKSLQDEARAAAVAAGQRARAQADAIDSARLATAQALAEKDGVVTLRERLNLIQKERDIEEKKAGRLGKKQQAVELEKITAQVEAKVADAVRAQEKLETDAAAGALDARRKLAEIRIKDRAEKLRADGELAAAELENQQIIELQALNALQDYQTKVAALEADGTKSKAEQLALRTKLDADYVASKLQTDAQLLASAKAIEAAQQAEAAKLGQSISKGADAFGKAAQMAGGTTGKGLQQLAASSANVGKNWKSMKESAGDAVSAMGDVVAAFVDGEKTKAGILAIMESAAAAVAYAGGNIPSGVAHTAAAAMYASIATGLVSTSGASSGGQGGFSTSEGVSGGQSGSGSSGGKTVVVNFNQPLATKQDIGKAVAGALRSIGGTGQLSLKGA